MDWSRARGILLVAFFLVNLILAYSIWGPVGIFPELVGTPHQQQVAQVRRTLLGRGFDLATSVPSAPREMRFLRVEFQPTLVSGPSQSELSGVQNLFAGDSTNGDPSSQVAVYSPRGQGDAARELRLENQQMVQSEVLQYLKSQHLLPADAILSGVFKKPPSTNVTIEYSPVFDQHPVFSGYVRVEVSPRGIEEVQHYWVQPKGYKEAPPKAVRPAAEALLRLVGHLERLGTSGGTITEIRLGYYAGRTLTSPQEGVINAWDTVPVWRITLNGGDVYFVNAFNGELEA